MNLTKPDTLTKDRIVSKNKVKPKIIVWDIETSYMVLAKFDLYPDYVQPTNILQDWYIMCAAWMDLSEKRIHGVSTLDDLNRFKKDPTDDYVVVKTLRDMVADADLIIAHNGDKFDLPKLNARIIYHGLEPLPPIFTVDTRKELRKIAKFSSNKLDYLTKLMGLESKLKTGNELWLNTLKHKKTALRRMLTYCRQDVKILKDFYLKIRPYIKNHPVIYYSEKPVCPACGSDDIQWRGYARTRTKKYKRFQCQNCGKWGRERKSSIKDKTCNVTI